MIFVEITPFFARPSRSLQSPWPLYKKMRELYILGAGGLGKEMAWHLEMLDIQSKGFCFVGFLDDDECKWKSQVYGYSVLGKLEDVLTPGAFVLLGVGDPQQRLLGMKRIKAKDGILYNLVGPDV